MKRPKKATPTLEQYIGSTGRVTCPHCKTILQSGMITSDILRIKCYNCKNPIDLVW